MRSETDDLRYALVRFNALTFSCVFALLLGVALFVSTLFLMLKGGETPGARIGLLGQYLPGYDVTFGGACIGFLWATLLGFALSYLPANIYYRGVLGAVKRAGARADDDDLLSEQAEVHVLTFAASFGMFAGGLLFVATLWLVIKHKPGEILGPHLGLLDNYLPGYSVSIGGALLGFLYLLVIGGAAFALVGWIYNCLVRRGPRDRAAS